MTPDDARRTFPAIHPKTTEAVNFTLDLLESHLIELRQRQLSEEQVDRFGRLLKGAESGALTALRGGHRCPCPCCLTTVHDGNLRCAFCRRHA